MPLYPEKIVRQFEERKEDLKSESIGDLDLINKYIRVLKGLKKNFFLEKITEKLSKYDYPGAVPSSEFRQHDSVIVHFEDSSNWGSHQTVNKWARTKLEDITTVGVDGSQINPTPEFDRPIGLVQVARIINRHKEGGSYDRKVETEILSTDDLMMKDSDTDYAKLDDQEVHVRRFEIETRLLKEGMEQYKSEDEPPVFFYDGSLLIWFITHLDPDKKERYGRAMGELLASSRKHKIPVVGYVGGSNATELKKMIINLDLITQSEEFLIHDYQFVSHLTDNWGDRTILFNSLQSKTTKWLKADHQGEHFDFSEDIMFTYLNTGGGPQLDRIEMPRWIFEDGFLEYTMDVIRAENAIGRGFPEILQQADADAVINGKDRERFLRMYQKFSEENDIELRWNKKAKSKKRRRR